MIIVCGMSYEREKEDNSMKLKSLLPLLLALMMVFALVACGDDDEKSGECNHK